MRKLNGFEEYVGYWVSYWDWNSSGSFRMFIDNRLSLKDGTEIVGGRIKDRNGKARFGGEISRERVRLVKIYEPKHCDMSAAKGEIVFEGNLVPIAIHGKNYYEGRYTAYEGEKVVSSGSFVLEKYVPTQTLEFLMRWEHMGELRNRRSHNILPRR